MRNSEFFWLFLQNIWLDWSFWTDFMWNIWNNGKSTQKYRWNSCFRNRDWLLFKMKPNKTDFLCFIWKFLRFFNVIFHLFDVIFRDFKCHKKDIFGVAKCHIITGPRYKNYLRSLFWIEYKSVHKTNSIIHCQVEKQARKCQFIERSLPSESQKKKTWKKRSLIWILAQNFKYFCSPIPTITHLY